VNPNLQLKQWTTFLEASWYTYGAFMSKATILNDSSNGAHRLRWFLAIWLFYGFLLTYAYSGNLTAFLTQPAYTTPIATLADVLQSGLPWGMVGLVHRKN